jgi:hypothetical protein
LRNNIIFEELNGVAPGNVLRPYSKLGKVYRETYAINREWLKLRKEKNTPALFRNIFLKDVTAEYSPVADLKIDILPLKERKNAVPYLAVFDNREWVPVALGAVEDRKALFKDMCMNIVYFPMYNTEKGQEMLNYPFLPEYSGNIRYFVPDTTRRRTVVLHRKYPVFTKTFDATAKIIGSKIQAASKEDFRDSITVHSIDAWQSSGSIRLNDSVPSYRYWRFYSPNRGDSNIAELMFFRQNDTVPFMGRIIGTDKLYKNDTVYSREKVFDNNPLSYFHAAAPDCSWVGLDFGEPVKIERVIYYPRSDGNNIRLGDEYELFYWSDKGWTSLGRQKAKDISLKFTGVPDNALLWLHDKTGGIEERIFTYENGKQVWW